MTLERSRRFKHSCSEGGEVYHQYINGQKLEDQNRIDTKEVHEEGEAQDQVYVNIMGQPVL